MNIAFNYVYKKDICLKTTFLKLFIPEIALFSGRIGAQWFKTRLSCVLLKKNIKFTFNSFKTTTSLISTHLRNDHDFSWYISKGKQQHRHMFTYSYVGMRKNVNNWNKIFLFITVFTFFYRLAHRRCFIKSSHLKWFRFSCIQQARFHLCILNLFIFLFPSIVVANQIF